MIKSLPLILLLCVILCSCGGIFLRECEYKTHEDICETFPVYERTILMIQHKIEALRTRHRQLDEKIKQSYSFYLDDSLLHKMKQEKLHIKDQIEKFIKQI
jgi:hypothetical protein